MSSDDLPAGLMYAPRVRLVVAGVAVLVLAGAVFVLTQVMNHTVVVH